MSSLNGHKTIRIYEEDHEKIRNIAFHQKRTMLDVLSEAIDIIDKKYGARSENEKKDN